MTNQFHYQPDQVASHLSQLYQQSTLNKQRTTSTTKKPEIRESPKESIRSDIDNPIKHRLASPTNPTGELHLPKTEEIVEKNSPHVDRNDRIQPIDLSKLVVNSNISHINSNIPLEKPKPDKSSKGTQSSHSEDDQEISETENHETVSESETEDRLKEIHALTHSQFIQRVPVSQAKEKSS